MMIKVVVAGRAFGKLNISAEERPNFAQSRCRSAENRVAALLPAHTPHVNHTVAVAGHEQATVRAEHHLDRRGTAEIL